MQLNSSCLLVAMEMVVLNLQSPEKVLETHSTMSLSSHWCDKQIYWGPKFQIHDLVITWTYSYSKSISRKKKHPLYGWRMDGGFYIFSLKAYSQEVPEQYCLTMAMPPLTSWVGTSINFYVPCFFSFLH